MKTAASVGVKRLLQMAAGRELLVRATNCCRGSPGLDREPSRLAVRPNAQGASNKFERRLWSQPLRTGTVRGPVVRSQLHHSS